MELAENNTHKLIVIVLAFIFAFALLFTFGLFDSNYAIGQVHAATALGCKGDYDHDGAIGVSDFSSFAKNYKKTGIDCSLDIIGNDCILNIGDLGEFSKVYKQTGACTSGSTNTFPQVDSTSNTDKEVNSFLKSIVASGNHKVMAAGAWWGPVTKFFQNQIWVVNKTFLNGNQIAPNSNVSQQIACLLPGQALGLNTLNKLYMNVHQHNSNGKEMQNPTLGQFYTMTFPFTDVDTAAGGDSNIALYREARAFCSAFEGVTNNFGDGSATRGDRIQVNIDQTLWTGPKGTPKIHIPGTAHYDPIDAHIWYENIEYFYISLDGACNNGPCANTVGNLSNTDLVGATVKGQLTLYAYLYKLDHESTVPFHHIELRIDEEDKDYTVERFISPPTGTDDTLGTGLSASGRKALTLDTTKISDGWHIISWHSHVIDHTSTGPTHGKQLAGEIKFPICVDNHGQGNCT